MQRRADYRDRDAKLPGRDLLILGALIVFVLLFLWFLLKG
jgi:hypothetical protein